jgi:hypothetical protein
LLSLLDNSIEYLAGQSIAAVQGVETTQDVATFSSTDPNAVPSDFTATIEWGTGVVGGSTTAGTITEDASHLFHVSGTTTFKFAGPIAPDVIIRDANGTVYATGDYYQTNLVSSVPGEAVDVDPNLINP